MKPLTATRLLVTHVEHHHGQFGVMSYINFRSPVDGDRYFWRASRKVCVEPGQHVIVSGYTKGVDESGCTLLLRCQIEGEDPAPRSAAKSPERRARDSGGPIPADSRLGQAVMAVDSGSSWLATIGLVIASALTFIPLLGVLIAVFLIPTLLIIIGVLAFRLNARKGKDVAGTHIVKRNLILTICCVPIALAGAGYQIAVAVIGAMS